MNTEKKVITLNVNNILPNRFQPRIHFNESKITELSESIKKYGVIQPITVRQIGDKYEIITGERRYKATIMAGLSEIPAIINNLNDKDSSEVALIENVQRENLTPIEEATSYKKILDMGYLTQEKLASKLGLSQSTVANKLRLLQLTEEVQESLLEGKISERHARSLLKITDSDQQIFMLNRIIKERLTVRRTDEEIKKLVNQNLEQKNENNESQKVPNEIEVLEILESMKNKKEDEINMNSNDPTNQFKIPNISIENDNMNNSTTNIASLNVPPQVIVPQQAPISNMQTNINSVPEMVDIPNQVEIPSSRDINFNQNQNVINPKTVEDTIPIQPIVSIPTEENVMQPTAGKFFDVIPGGDSNPILTSPVSNNASPDNSSMFSSAIPSQDNQNINNIFESIPLDPTPQIMQPSSPTSEIPVINIQNDLNIPNNNISEVQNISTEPIQMNTVDSSVIQNASSIDAHRENLSQLNPETSVFINGINNPQVNNNVMTSSEVSFPNPVSNVPNMNRADSTIEDSKIISPLNQINSGIPETIQNPNFIANPLFNENQTVSSEIKQNEIQIGKPISYNLKEGIKICRNLILQLESLGLRVDMDEIDLSNSYDITIHIQKD